MTQDQPDDIERSDGENWDWKTETREWSAAETELACFALARRKGKQLIKIINTKKPPMQFICIFKDYPE
ncbi:hypothetical protein F7734_13195 [Scytonema sp. UIC 10036]|uniref:hypothetical protein n=1 Tax=Scytonema sp. UIC 10036 TaxID=2304196 RepID=UPI0012DA0844|nr:hypothetical protein [Scytonema sp. UIC 10036]MUG93331.1 hypothetical protein [Scytonema sp. UIC 10036]